MKRGVAKSIVIPQILHHCKQRKELFIVCVEIFYFSKREPSESVGNNLPRANRRVLHHSLTGNQKAKILKQTVFALGFCW